MSFLAEAVSDVRLEEESALHEAVALSLVACRLEKGQRREAVQLCAQELARAQAFEKPQRLPELLLCLIGIESELGEHDEAERHLRELLRVKSQSALEH